MKKIITIMLICFCTSSIASVKSVYNRLLRATGERPLPIYVKRGATCSLACTDGSKIVLNTKLLTLVRNEDELAGVIGHEMGHRYYNNELEADILGLRYVKAAGYNYCKAAQFLKGMRGDRKHPEGWIRYRNTGCK